MRICIISGFAIETVAPLHPSYAGLEFVVGNLGMELGKEHNVTTIAAEGSKVPNCKVIEVVKPHWSREIEKVAFEKYKDLLPQFDVIIDHTHWKDSWILKKEHPSLPMIFAYHDWFNCSSPCPVKVTHVAPSKAHADHLSRYLGHVHVIHHGIPVELYPFKEEKDDFLLYLGRIAPYKGAHIAIELAEKVGMHLKIAGMDIHTEDPDYIWWVMKKAQERGFDYLGMVDLRTKLKLLSKAKAVVLPYTEPYRCVFDLVQVEAMACGTPVVIADRDSAEHEIIVDGKTGFICKSESDFLDALSKIDEIRPKDCRKHVEKHFSSERMAKDFSKLCEIES